jgi:hypothetical protein
MISDEGHQDCGAHFIPLQIHWGFFKNSFVCIGDCVSSVHLDLFSPIEEPPALI